MTGVIAAARLVADPPKVDPPPAAEQTADQSIPRTDLFGDPLPDGVLMRLGTTRSRASIAGFGILPDGTVVTASPYAEVRIWSPKADRPGERGRLPVKEARFFNPRPAVSPDGRYVGANTPDKLLVVWERKDGGFKEVATFDLGSSRLLFSPDSTRFAAGTRICDIRTGKYFDLDVSHSAFEAMAFSGDGKRLAAATGYEAFLWDLGSGKPLARYKTGRLRYMGIALNHAGDVLAVSPTWEPETVVFVDPMTGARLPTLSGPDKFRCLWANFAPDGKTILLGDRSGVTWWDPAAGKVIQRFEGVAHSWSGGQNVLARFTPDGKTLVGTSGRMLLRWDAATGKPLLPEAHDAGHHARHHRHRGVGGREVDRHRRLRRSAAGLGRGNRPTGRRSSRSVDAGHTQPRLQPGRPVRVWPQSGDVGLSKWEAATGREVLRFGFSPDATRRGDVKRSDSRRTAAL